MTKREEAVFVFMVAFFMEEGYPPSIREIAAALYVTNNTIHRHLTNLTEKGLIRHTPKVARGYIPIPKKLAM